MSEPTSDPDLGRRSLTPVADAPAPSGGSQEFPCAGAPYAGAPAPVVGGVTTLTGAVDRAARLWPDRPAWTFDLPGARTVLTFAEVQQRSGEYARALLDRGVVTWGRDGPGGERVGVMLPNVAEFPLVWLALAQLGAAMVPLNTKLRSVDAEHLLRTAGVRHVVTNADLSGLVDGLNAGQHDGLHAGRTDGPAGVEAVDVADLRTTGWFIGRDDRDPAEVPVNIQFTSGTTGRPKGCVLTHEYWLTLGAGLVTGFPHLSEGDVMLTAQPFSYVDPQWNVVAALLSGAHLVVLDGFHPSTFWSTVREHGVTYFYCLGAMPTLLLRMPADPADRTHRVRLVQASGLPPALHAELEQRWGAPWFEAFGMTESGADIRVGTEDHDELVGTGCIGRPVPHREVRIQDGELLLRGPGMMRGYLGLDDVFDQGWLHTGDLARQDEYGRVYLTGRSKDMIRRSGENVAAREVEEVLMSHPAVRLAAVVGVPDEVRGEEVKAFVVGAATETELLRWCGERLAAFKVPRFWEFRDHLPMTPSQRVAKEKLR